MEGMGMGLVSAWGNIIGNALSNEWEKEATEEQYQNQMGLSAYNANLAVRNWQKTNFEEQRRLMERAGLSVGMMYSKGGGQGVSSTPPGQMSKRNVVPMDFTSSINAALQAKQLALQEKQVEASVANTEADTKNKEIQAQQATGVDLQTKEVTLENLKAQNQKLGNEVAIGQLETKLKEIEANIANETERDIIYRVKAEASTAMDNSRSAYVKANVDQKTQDEQIKQIEQTTKEQGLRMLVMKLTGDKVSMETAEARQQIREIAMKIEKMQIDAENQSKEVVIKQRELLLKEIATDFMYGDEARALRLLQAGERLLGGGKTAKTDKGMRPMDAGGAPRNEP